MSVVVRHPIFIDYADYDTVDEILTQFYQRGDLDSVTVETIYIADMRNVRMWLECGKDDLIAIQNELKNREVNFT